MDPWVWTECNQAIRESKNYNKDKRREETFQEHDKLGIQIFLANTYLLTSRDLELLLK